MSSVQCSRVASVGRGASLMSICLLMPPGEEGEREEAGSKESGGDLRTKMTGEHRG